MRKFRRKVRGAQQAYFAVVIMGAVALPLMSMIPTQIYPVIIAAAILYGSIKFMLRTTRRPSKFINERGYVVLTNEKDLEHRHIAKCILNRDLSADEVVHHINGIKTDNHLRNLCLMNREKHELFHSWLRWKKEKKRRYPPLIEQKRILVNEFDGVLLADAKYAPNGPRKAENAYTPELQMQLLKELKKERTRIARENDVPAYMVFTNRTLREMSKTLPTNNSDLLSVHGVGQWRLNQYGQQMIAIIKRFIERHNLDFGEKEVSA